MSQDTAAVRLSSRTPEHRWIDITMRGDMRQHNLCATCGLRRARTWRDKAMNLELWAYLRPFQNQFDWYIPDCADCYPCIAPDRARGDWDEEF